jgi:CRISPR/Cas system-associated protein Csm6
MKSQEDLENTFYSKAHAGYIALLGMLFGLTSFYALFQEVKEVGVPIPLLAIRISPKK